MNTFIKITALFAVICIQTTIFSQSNLRCAKFIDSNNGAIAADNGVIQVTTDAGYSWNNFSTGFKNNLYCIHLMDANTAVAAGQGGIIIKSTDGFATWQQKASGISTDLKSMDMNSGGNMIETDERSITDGFENVSRDLHHFDSPQNTHN